VLVCLALAAGCAALSNELQQIVALEVVVPDSGLVVVGDTLRPRARALDGNGDSVAATIRWATLDTAVLAVDSLSGATAGKAAGSGRLQARVANLRSSPLSIAVQPLLDSIAADGPRRDTIVVSAPDSLSDSLRVKVFANTGTPIGSAALVRREVVFTVVIYPDTGATVTFVPRDTVHTNLAGLAITQLRYTGGARPDSAVVTAAAAGVSPVTFVVEFRP
jgi:hypothetical protein